MKQIKLKYEILYFLVADYLLGITTLYYSQTRVLYKEEDLFNPSTLTMKSYIIYIQILYHCTIDLNWIGPILTDAG